MGETVKALLAIYAALGGSASTAAINTIPEALALIATQVSSTLELPKVTSDDNGKVLKVVDGAWSKSTEKYPELPAVSATDNGSVLKVVEGAWAVGQDAIE